jgi:hypothetical protein
MRYSQDIFKVYVQNRFPLTHFKQASPVGSLAIPILVHYQRKYFIFNVQSHVSFSNNYCTIMSEIQQIIAI